MRAVNLKRLEINKKSRHFLIFSIFNINLIRFIKSNVIRKISRDNVIKYKYITSYTTLMTSTEIDRIIEMAWEDRTPFEAIKIQFGITEADVIKLMRKELKESSFKRWRKRVNSGVSSKHLHKRSEDIKRFRSSRQKSISNNKISKR